MCNSSDGVFFSPVLGAGALRRARPRGHNGQGRTGRVDGRLSPLPFPRHRQGCRCSVSGYRYGYCEPHTGADASTDARPYARGDDRSDSGTDDRGA